MEKYKIVQDLVWQCRISSVVPKSNFVVLKFCKHDTGEHLFSIIRRLDNLNIYREHMANKTVHTIHRIVIESNVLVYHKITWDDVERGISTKEHVGEVQRDETGNFIKWRRVVVYANLDEKFEPSAGNQFYKENVEIDSRLALTAITYNNRETYLASHSEIVENEVDEEEEEREYYRMMDAAYAAYEKRQYDEIGMSEEDRIMSALENGEGEYYGF